MDYSYHKPKTDLHMSNKTNTSTLVNSYRNSNETLTNLYERFEKWLLDEESLCHLIGQAMDVSSSNGSEGAQCNNTWDGYLCWPSTRLNTTAVLPCPAYLKGIPLDPTNNASKRCFENGSWQTWTNYSACSHLSTFEQDSVHGNIVRVIFDVGYCLSTASLLIALIIFIYFRRLRCTRNAIHSHLIVSFILKNTAWLILNNTALQLSESTDQQWVCKLISTLYNFFTVTNFFWMLVEGLYLHIMIVWAYSVENIKLRYYILIAWAVPAIFIVIWVIVKWKLEDTVCWLNLRDSFIEYIYIGPILFVLLMNVVFLMTIVKIVMIKLRASNTNQSQQYWKTAKATIFLFPLLGMIYLIMITTPEQGNSLSTIIFLYINAIFQSTQGFAIAVCYCFLNKEVQNVVRERFKRRHEHHSIGQARCSKSRVSVDLPNRGAKVAASAV